MRKPFLFVAVVVALIAAFAATASRAEAAAIKATGAGWVSFQPVTPKHYVHFEVSARERPLVDFGQVDWRLEEPTTPIAVRVDLDCVNIFPAPLVTGAAWVAGTVTSVSPQPNFFGVMPGDRQEFYLVDGGNPSATTPVDEFSPLFSEAAPCKTLGDIGYFPDVTQGNVNISTG
jgi:hypothetical protein